VCSLLLFFLHLLLLLLFLLLFLFLFLLLLRMFSIHLRFLTILLILLFMLQSSYASNSWLQLFYQKVNEQKLFFPNVSNTFDECQVLYNNCPSCTTNRSCVWCSGNTPQFCYTGNLLGAIEKGCTDYQWNSCKLKGIWMLVIIAGGTVAVFLVIIIISAICCICCCIRRRMRARQHEAQRLLSEKKTELRAQQAQMRSAARSKYGI